MVISRFFDGKMLMLIKLSLRSFIYELVKGFFPDEKTKNVYEKYSIVRVQYYIVTDTDTTSAMFLYICKIEISIPDNKFKDLIFEVIISNNIINRFDRFHQFWKNFNVRDDTLKKKIGYYEVEHIDDLLLIALAINPKDYSKYFENAKPDKKQKGVRNGLSNMELEDFTSRINYI